MLSRKQIWRRIKSKRDGYLSIQQDNEKANLAAKSSYASTASMSTVRSLSPISDAEISEPMEACAINRKNSKRVRFSNIVKTCLIPTRSELQSLAPHLYWSCADCETSKAEAVEELTVWAKKHNCSLKEAIVALYQPGQRDELTASSPPGNLFLYDCDDDDDLLSPAMGKLLLDSTSSIRRPRPADS